LNFIKNSVQNQIADIIEKKIMKLENDYKKNPYIEDVEIIIEEDEIDIKIETTFKPRDEEQNIPLLFEYGGVVYDVENNLIEIEPGFYIRRNIADGNTK
jgi:hypothetical protein